METNDIYENKRIAKLYMSHQLLEAALKNGIYTQFKITSSCPDDLQIIGVEQGIEDRLHKNFVIYVTSKTLPEVDDMFNIPIIKPFTQTIIFDKED